MATPRLVRVAFQALLREGRRLSRAHEQLTLFRPVDVRQWGSGDFAADSSASDAAKLQADLFPGVSFAATGADSSVVLSGQTLCSVVRAEFRRALPPGGDAGKAVDRALAHLATINRLRAADACRTVTRTRYGDDVVVDVEVASQFMPVLAPQELARMRAFPFAYRVAVSNRGSQTVQLLGRAWQFRDAAGSVVVEVPRHSPGVVGHAPVLEPGQTFVYTSGTQLPTPSGSFAGSFQMVVSPSSAGGAGTLLGGGGGGSGEGSDTFDAHVASTRLAGPAGLDDVMRAAEAAEEADSTHRDR